MKGKEFNQLLRYSFYGFIVCLFGFFIGLAYVGADIAILFINYNEFLLSVKPLILGLFSIGCSVYTIVVGIFGCIAIVKFNRPIITVFLVMLGISILLNLIISIIAFTSTPTYKGEYENMMKVTMVLYDDAFFFKIKNQWDTVQKDYNCCGVNEPSDWKSKYGFTPNPEKVPSSCCTNYMDECNLYSSNLKPNGCLDPLMNDLDNRIFNIAIVAIVNAGFQVIGIPLGLLMSNAARNSF